MGPKRTIYERRFFLTEPAFSAELGRFFERPVPHPTFGQATAEPSAPDDAPEAPEASKGRAE